jgi:anti-anti-sigma factor
MSSERIAADACGVAASGDASRERGCDLPRTGNGDTMHAIATSAPAGGEARGELEVGRRALDERTCLVEVAGEVDLASAPALKSALNRLLDECGRRDVVLDLSRLTHLDSTGLAVLIGFRRRLSGGRRMVIAAATEQVLRLLKLTGVDAAFDTAGTVGEAAAYLAAARSPGAPVLSPDAALVVGLAATAVPFAQSFGAEAECWLRILLPYGDLPLGDGQLPARDLPLGEGELAAAGVDAADVRAPGHDHDAARAHADHRQRTDSVIAEATRIATGRGAPVVRTGDVLRAVAAIYGVAFERALRSQAHEYMSGAQRLSAGLGGVADPVGLGGAADAGSKLD